MVLGFLAVEAEGHIVTELGKGDRRGRGQGDALVGGAEDHVEADAGRQRRLGVVPRELAQLEAVVEKAGVEEVRGQPPRLRPEFAEPEHPGADRKLDELPPEILASRRGGGSGGGGHRFTGGYDPRLFSHFSTTCESSPAT